MRQRGSGSDDWGGGRLWRSRLINRVVLPGAEVQGGVTQYKTCQSQSSAAVGHFVLPDWSPVISCCTRISSPAFIKPRDIRVERNRARSLKLSFHYCFILCYSSSQLPFYFQSEWNFGTGTVQKILIKRIKTVHRCSELLYLLSTSLRIGFA